MVAGGRRRGGGNCSQKAQTSSYKISKYWGCNVQHDKYNQHCGVLCAKIKSSHHKETIFKIFVSYLCDMMSVH